MSWTSLLHNNTVSNVLSFEIYVALRKCDNGKAFKRKTGKQQMQTQSERM